MHPPLYHTGAKMHWFGNFIAGARSVILNGIEPRWILETISEEAVTVVWLLVPWALDILFAVESGELKLTDYRLEQWRLMHIGAQTVPPSLRLGEIATAIIQVKPGKTLTTEAVNAFCADLPRYKRPRKIIFDSVPRNPTGKIEKPKLRRMYAGAEGTFKIDA